jgi:hypothetical protein
MSQQRRRCCRPSGAGHLSRGTPSAHMRQPTTASMWPRQRFSHPPHHLPGLPSAHCALLPGSAPPGGLCCRTGTTLVLLGCAPAHAARECTGPMQPPAHHTCGAHATQQEHTNQQVRWIMQSGSRTICQLVAHERALQDAVAAQVRGG